MSSPAPIETQESLAESHPYVDNWDRYWLEMALTAGRKSKDPKCRVGAVIVSDEIIVSTGFNGLARQVFDNPEVLGDADEKLKMICHAEQNAIYNAARAGVALKGATIYVTKFPCLACCNAIIQAGITTIHTHDTKYWGDDPADGDHSRKKSVLRQAKVKIVAPFHPDYAAERVAPRTANAPAANAQGTGAASPALTALPPVKASRTPKKKSKKALLAEKNMKLWPGRKPIQGGESG